MRLLGANVYRVVPNQPINGQWNLSPLTYYDLVGKMRGFGGNCIKIYSRAAMWLTPGLAHDALSQARQRAKEVGITFAMTGHGDRIYPATEKDGYINKAAVILNENGLGDQWINDYVTVIRELQPDALEIMNEPPDATLGNHPALTFAAYRTFITRAIEAYRAAKPDLTLCIDGCPFWTQFDFAKNPLPYQNLLYCFHLHYMGTAPLSTSDPVSQWFNNYWNGNLATAKVNLEAFMNTYEGLSALKTAGLSILFTESGTWMTMPHWDAWLQDMFDLAKKYNSGFLEHSFGANPPDIDSILNADWATLNNVGLIWQKNIQQAAGLSLPQLLGLAALFLLMRGKPSV